MDQFQNEIDRTCYTTCPNMLYSNKITRKCTDSCPDGTYPDTISKECTFCNASCYTCTGPINTNCVSCYPFASLVTGKCNCDITYYGFSESLCTTPQSCFNCRKCFTGCAVCNGSTSSDCEMCIQNYFLTNSNSVLN